MIGTEAAFRLLSELFGLTNLEVIVEGGQKLAIRGLLDTESVVAKIAVTGQSPDPAALERCRREVGLLRSISSPNIVSLRSDLVEVPDGPGTVAWLEEYIPGQDLRDIQGPLWDCEQSLSFLRACASGLSELHQHGFIHRDLSPGNVRRRDDGTWIVLDPGFAKHLGRSDITGPWQPGTPGYMSPEHASFGGRILKASDVFQVGVLAYERLSGSLPIDPSPNPASYRMALYGANTVPLIDVRPDLPDALCTLIDDCLERQPARRVMDGPELVERLKEVTC